MEVRYSKKLMVLSNPIGVIREVLKIIKFEDRTNPGYLNGFYYMDDQRINLTIGYSWMTWTDGDPVFFMYDQLNEDPKEMTEYITLKVPGTPDLILIDDA